MRGDALVLYAVVPLCKGENKNEGGGGGGKRRNQLRCMRVYMCCVVSVNLQISGSLPWSFQKTACVGEEGSRGLY